MITDMIPISKIKEHPSNPRTHTIEQIQKIAKSIQGNGWEDRSYLVTMIMFLQDMEH